MIELFNSGAETNKLLDLITEIVEETTGDEGLLPSARQSRARRDCTR